MEAFLALGVPMTFAVIPRERHSRELAEHAERIVHLLDGVMIRDEVVAERRVAEVRPDAEPA